MTLRANRYLPCQIAGLILGKFPTLLLSAPDLPLFNNQPATHLASSDAKCEAVSQPYRFDLELVSEDPDLDLESLLHKRAFLAFDPQGNGIHGQIHRVAQGDAGKRLTRYHLSIVPQLSYLAHRTNQRIYSA